jgi:hypothetical protein
MRLALLKTAAFTFALALAAPSAHAQDDGKTSEDAPTDPNGFVPLVGGSVGFVDGSRRVGFSADVALDLLVRRTFGAVGLVTGLRPHFERFGLGKSDDYDCAGSVAGPCASGSTLYLSHTAANAFSLEVPLAAELRSGRKSGFVPFVGVSPWLVHLRSSERAKGILPDTTTTTTDASNTFFALGAFAGVNIYVNKTASITLRAGWRFAPDLALPGGSASVRGESVSIGYRVEL